MVYFVVFVWFILFRYECRKSGLLAPNCASVLRVLCGSDCSEVCMGGIGAFINLLCYSDIFFCIRSLDDIVPNLSLESTHKMFPRT